MHFAFNGWPLARDEPEAALHLVDLLQRLPALAPHHRYSLLLPSGRALPSYNGVASVVIPAGKGEWARLRLEQRRFPRQAGSLGADLLYYPYPAAPLASRVPVAVWNGCGGDRRSPQGLAGRLRAGLGFAGLAGAAARISSGPIGVPGAGVRRIPPMAPRAFGPDEEPQDRAARKHYDLPDAYVLADGVRPEDVGLLLAGWTWVDSTMGDVVRLVVLGQRRGRAKDLRRRAEDLGLGGSVRVVEEVRAEDFPAIFRGAEAFVFAGWGYTAEAVQWALASGMAIVGVENPEAGTLLGPAGYLVRGRDARLFGAACITVLAESEVRERLRGRARERGALLTADAPLQALLGYLEEAADRAAPRRRRATAQK